MASYPLTLLCIKWVPRDPSSIFFATSYTQKMPEISDSMYSSFFMLENIRHYHFTWNGLNSQESVNFLRFSSGPWGPTIGAKFTISREFSPFQAKWWYLTFSSLKKEEYIESKLSGFFLSKSCRQKYSALILGDPASSCFSSVISLF